MKVVHIFWSLGYGGTETMLINIANNQVELGAEVHIIIVNDIIEQKIVDKLSKNVFFHRIGRKLGSKSPMFVLSINKVLRNVSPDVVHLHCRSLFDLLLPKWRIRTCCTIHDTPRGIISRPNKLIPYVIRSFMMKNGYTNIAEVGRIPQIYAISDIVHDVLKADYAVDSTTVHNGINTIDFKQKEENLNRAKCGLFHIVQVSRLVHEKKGQDLLIKAIALLRQRGYDNVTVDFIGDGESKDYLHDLIIDNGLQDQIKLLGQKNQKYLQTHLCEYDLFVQPSRKEGFGLTVAEALSAKVPVLVSKGEGPEEIICGEKYGWVFTSDNVESLADKICYIINNPEQVMCKADEALLRVKQCYDIKCTAKKYLETYKIYKNE